MDNIFSENFMEGLLKIIDKAVSQHEKLIEQKVRDEFQYMDAKTAARYLGMKDTTFNKFVKRTNVEQILIDGMAPRYSKKTIDKIMEKNMY
ncbi:hypothetical protein [Latilactobacillus phage TMW 1.46 P2]|uniref:hypothetical protein n=1 Tax=Latilactobacillus sakei TaxID=1599 RepID=UPI002073ABB3|nr:hypothetical protein [Latilactobacillus sakei]MDR7924398.1 hypothetical protein [Latilactobacillus sakei subsp. sakei]USF96437.1 hypothetical protein A4W82_06270 [Latilactobacillus sakei]WAX23986.1 hypothetical protein [Latilactobacillus phage TMW 1.46 P2]